MYICKKPIHQPLNILKTWNSKRTATLLTSRFGKQADSIRDMSQHETHIGNRSNYVADHKHSTNTSTNALDLIKDIDFSSSFSDNSKSDYSSNEQDDSDLFDPADLEGLVLPSALKKETAQESNLQPSSLMKIKESEHDKSLLLKDAFITQPSLLRPVANVAAPKQHDSPQAYIRNPSSTHQSPTHDSIRPPSIINSPIKPQGFSVHQLMQLGGAPRNIEPLTSQKSSPIKPITSSPNDTNKRKFSPIKSNNFVSPVKKVKPVNLMQSRGFTTSANPKLKDIYPTIQLATQKPMSVQQNTEIKPSISSTKDLKNVKPIVLSSEQEYVLQLAKRGQSLFFTGSAGTGKSVLLRSIIKSLKSKYDPDHVAVTASTGLAACNIGGITLHSFAGIGLGDGKVEDLIKKVRKNKKAIRKWVNTKVLIIDEISMIDGRLLDKLDQIAKKIRHSQKPFGGIQIIACGDFYQLPPVSKPKTLENGEEVEDNALFAFESESWNKTIKASIILKEVFRQKGDQIFIDMLNSMRTGIVSRRTEVEFQRLSRPLICPAGIVPTQLFATRTEVDDANKRKLNQLDGQTRCFNSIDGGSLAPNIRQIFLNNFLAPQRLFLKKGAQVMCIKNFDETLVNGSLGQVVDFIDRDTYMCHSAFEEYPDLTINEIKDKIQESHELKQKSEEVDEETERTKPKTRLDSIFEFLLSYENKSFDTDSEEELFLQNSQRKMELLNMLRQSSTGEKLPLIKFLLPDGVNTRDVLVEPETWTIEDDKTKQVLVSRTQLPLMLAWALSIHKAQGQTLSKAKVDLSRVFENGQAYVALSRAVSRDGLQVLNFRKEKVTTHHKVQEFYKYLITAEELASISYEDESRPILSMELGEKKLYSDTKA